MSRHHFCALFVVLALSFAPAAALVRPLPAGEVCVGQGGSDFIIAAAGNIRGVNSLGYNSPAPGSAPRSSYGNNPGDYRRGYEGNSPYPGDPWNREADFKARNYQQQHGPQPQSASPPDTATTTRPPAQVYPSLPRPPLPGDKDFEVAPPPARKATRP